MKTTTSVQNVYEAIACGVIPGHFTEDYKQFIFKPIVTKDRRGNESTWTIVVGPYDIKEDKPKKFKKDMFLHRKVQENPDDEDIKKEYPTPDQLPEHIVGRIHVSNITHTGEERSNTDTDVSKGKNIGKKNNTNCITQAFKDAHSMYKLKLRKSSTTMSADRPLPMLVKKVGETKDATLTEEDYADGIYIERKYDGYRAMACLDPSTPHGVCIYSRSAIEYVGLEDIRAELKALIGDSNIYIDGELYSHNTSLQEISAKVRNASSITLKRDDVKYYIFDCYIPDVPKTEQRERKEILHKLFSINGFNRIVLVDSFLVHKESDLKTHYDKFIKEGYEGAIVRKAGLTYEFGINGHHSTHVLKMKPYNSAEYKIIDYTCGTKGKDLGAIIFVLETEDCTKFNAVPNMPIPKRKEMYEQFKAEGGEELFKNEYKGKYATIQYSILSKLGTPQQPKFICIRDQGI